MMSPTLRITLGLVSLTTSILLVSDLIGLTPNHTNTTLEVRKHVVESLAVQFSALTQKNELDVIDTTLEIIVARDDDIVSAAMRNKNGVIIAQAGDHPDHWVDIPGGYSTPTHAKVPIFKGKSKWATVEVTFRNLAVTGLSGLLANSLFKLVVFVASMGFLLYLLYLRRTLSHLDPSSVIPERVQAAFDVLAEGVLILDEHERIVLANTSFSEKVEIPAKALMGKKADHLPWAQRRTGEETTLLPWTSARLDGQSKTGIPLVLKTSSDHTLTFTVNGAPILDAKGKQRGILVTFDDMTELERKNEELHVLATQDPLTGCLNRRAFFECFDNLFCTAQENHTKLSCIMTDIDHFKSVNDRYGHGIGDVVIKLMAGLLKSGSRGNDVVGRYGGEEFCILLPNAGNEKAVEVAERLRIHIQQCDDDELPSDLHFTASLGVASLGPEIKEPSDLVNQADKALYVAKENGRNRVIRWAGETQVKPFEDKHPPNEKPAQHTNAKQAKKVDGEVIELKRQVEDLERALAQRTKELKQQSTIDDVTGLPNRVRFQDYIFQALARAHRFNNQFAVLSLDIDMFARVNDTLGHVAGDHLLKAVTHRLSDILRNTDSVEIVSIDMENTAISRLSNDEFGILLNDLKDVESVTWIVKRILDVLSKQINVDDNELYITGNIGISIYPNDGDSAEVLLKNASAARHYANKRLGRNKYQFYSEDINEKSSWQMQLESQLHRAIERNELVVYYQPKISTHDEKIVGMEALIRWYNPEFGLIAPDQFIPIAERSGQIKEIGKWVLKTACEQAKRWQDSGHESQQVAVNLSAVQFHQTNLAEMVVEVLNNTNLSPKYLELEITESVLMENLDKAAETLRALHDIGVKISIDDFGTGYSSFTYLKHFPVDILKIDQSFLHDITSDSRGRAIVQAIIDVAHSLDIEVVAEGVETEDQLIFLRSVQCDALQGYLFSRPLPEKEATQFLLDNDPTRGEAGHAKDSVQNIAS